jgi:hypothetical protein
VLEELARLAAERAEQLNDVQNDLFENKDGGQDKANLAEISCHSCYKKTQVAIDKAKGVVVKNESVFVVTLILVVFVAHNSRNDYLAREFVQVDHRHRVNNYPKVTPSELFKILFEFNKSREKFEAYVGQDCEENRNAKATQGVEFRFFL